MSSRRGFADIIVETEDPNAGIIVELKYNYDEMEQACKMAFGSNQ